MVAGALLSVGWGHPGSSRPRGDGLPGAWDRSSQAQLLIGTPPHLPANSETAGRRRPPNRSSGSYDQFGVSSRWSPA